MIFVIDSSASIGDTLWLYAKQFVMDVVQGLDVRKLRFLRKKTTGVDNLSKVFVCWYTLLNLVVDSQRSLCGLQYAYGQSIFHY